jgi:lipoprotein-anchoring transpeptidase ErfK/SrfK
MLKLIASAELIASIVVDLSDEKLYLYNQNREHVPTMLVSTGAAANPTGRGEVYSKHRSIYLHGAPWQEAGGLSFGVPRSHGCVRVPSPHVRWLYENTPMGTPVTIQS